MWDRVKVIWGYGVEVFFSLGYRVRYWVIEVKCFRYRIIGLSLKVRE